MRKFKFATFVGTALLVTSLLFFSYLFQADTVEAASVGSITKFEETDEKTFTITAGNDKVRVVFNREDMVRIWLGVGGNFTDLSGKFGAEPAEPIVVSDDFGSVEVDWSDAGDYYKMETSEFVLRAYKSPLKFAMYQKDNETVVWEEAASLMHNGTSTTQQLIRGDDEYYYGGGMQNGFFNHRDRKISIAANYGDWGSGTVSNPSPFYLSTTGYGVLRNTFQNGTYDFDSTLNLTHQENRFDAYYFYGDSMQDILDGYTDLTGKPTLIPRWGMGLGDADCYNKPPDTTTDVIDLIGKMYRDYDMPGGWILPNDGYGCGYTQLEETVDELNNLGFRTGLWTQDGVDKIAQEVGVAGTRLAKLDVAWVGPGYDFALDASRQAHEGIENNSDSRGYVWSVGGWAGTQRYSTVWSGDQSGNWEYIRFHIPTYIGAGLSGIPYGSSDVDGIFGGSAKTYVRDLQWKSFTPTMINMSGWAARDKQPWVWGEPYTSYNRDILKLRERLTPYFYTYLNEAYESGAPMVRGMIYEYPNDPNSKGTLTQYQFMSGESFLVAPVYSDTTVRNGIYLPKGKWIDYWTGEEHYGSKMLDEYDAPLDRLPLLVKGGAIIPMYPEALYDGQVPPNPITYDIYPYQTSTFTMYEDDGNTKEHREGKFATTTITSIAPNSGTGDLVIQVGASIGDYTGKLTERTNQFMIHMPNEPTAVTVSDATYANVGSKAAWESATSGWYYDAEDKGGILYVKTSDLPVDQGFELKVSGFVADTTPLLDEVKIELPQVDADPSRIPQQDMIATATSADATAPVMNVLDSNFESIWSTPLSGTDTLPQSITLNLGFKQPVNKLKYMPRQYGGTNGIITKYNVYTSLDGVDYTLVSSGEWAMNKLEKAVTFDTVEALFVKLEAIEGAGGFASAAEVNLYRDLTKPAPTAIAKNLMTASALSFQPGAEASKAIDGEANSVWHTKWDGSDKLPQSIIVDLGKSYTISQFRYAPRMDAGNGTITSYNLYVSSDGQTYTKIAEGSWIRDNIKKYIAFNSVSARYVKLEAVAAIGGFVSASELDVYEAPKAAPEIQLISEGKPASADSEDAEHPAAAGNDGNPATKWSANDTNLNHAWTVDLGGMYSIQSSQVYFADKDKLYKYKIDVREEGSTNWITVVDRTNNSSIGEVITDNFGSQGRYARITITGLPDAESKASFMEFKLYGIPLSEGQLPTSITLDQPTLMLQVLDNPVPLVATVLPENAINKSVIWSSSDPGIASVDANGMVTPKGQGTATITATTLEGGFSATSEVTVTGQTGLIEIPQSQMTATATSEQTGVNDAVYAIDGNPETHWHTKWFNVDPLPQSLTVELGGTHNISKIGYLPRPEASNGTITAYNVYTSVDGVNYTRVASGNWLRDKQLKEANFAPVEAAYVKLEAVQGVGDFASVAEFTVFQNNSISSGLQSQLTGPSTVRAGENFRVQFGLVGVTEAVYAQDITVNYDASILDFVSAKSIIEDVTVIETIDTVPGKLRFILASEGADHAVNKDAQILELGFKAKALAKAATGTIEVTHAILGHANGEETLADPAAIEILITLLTLGDNNLDGRISIGDLSLLAIHYGKDENSSDWEKISHLDIVKDGKIDILDLAQVAQLIINA